MLKALNDIMDNGDTSSAKREEAVISIKYKSINGVTFIKAESIYTFLMKIRHSSPNLYEKNMDRAIQTIREIM